MEGWFPPRSDWWGEILASLGFEGRPEPDDLGLTVVPCSWDPEEDFRRRLYYTRVTAISFDGLGDPLNLD